MKENRRKITNRSITNFYSKELYTIIRSAYTKQKKKKRKKKRNMEIRFTTPCCVRRAYAICTPRRTVNFISMNETRNGKKSFLNWEHREFTETDVHHTPHSTAQHSHRQTVYRHPCTQMLLQTNLSTAQRGALTLGETHNPNILYVLYAGYRLSCALWQ